MKLIITEDNAITAVVEDWQGPVPREGDYIYHPRDRQPRGGMYDGVMSVKSVTWGIIARPANQDVKHFVGADEPFVEVTV